MKLVRIPVLMYHNIQDTREKFINPPVPVSKFAKQMTFLYNQGYTTISFQDWLLWRENGTALPKKPIILTFDDGYQSIHQNAFPILIKYQFSAIVFLVVDYIGKTNFWDQQKGDPSVQLLSENEIKEMRKTGIYFGSHTKSHRSLEVLAERELQEEVAGSKKILETLLNEPVSFLAYPYGVTNPAICKQVKEAGYLAACGVESRFLHSSEERFALPRIGIDGTTSMFWFSVQLRLERTLEEIPPRSWLH